MKFHALCFRDIYLTQAIIREKLSNKQRESVFNCWSQIINMLSKEEERNDDALSMAKDLF